VSAQVAVATTSELAARAAVRLAAEGGNAVDAALSAVIVSMVCEPGIVAPGAAGFVTVAPADGGPAVTIDGNVEMPGRGLPPERFGRGVLEVESGYGGGLTIVVGHGSVATPGAFAAYDEAHRRYGRAPWREVLAPAYEAARDGFPLGMSPAYYFTFVRDSVFGWHPDSRAALHHPDGRPLLEGDTVHVPHLADSLRLIAEEGAATLYTGALAEAISADMEAHEGLLTAADLAAYEPVVRPALTLRAGDWDLATNPPPAIGGTTLAAMLALMKDRPAGPWTPDDVSHLIAVQDAVLAHRLEHLDVTDDRIAAAERLLALVADGDLRALRTSPSTVNVSVVDSDGNACTVTSSAGYGSGVMTPGTGLWLNNCLGEPELNRRGLHALPPGERLPSNMAPTVGRHTDGSVLAIGSPGADRITTALLQVLCGFSYAGMSLESAIAAPRVHVSHMASGPLVHHEEDVALPQVDAPLRPHPPTSMFFGGVGAALRDVDGTLTAAGDPRRAAVVAVGPDNRTPAGHLPR
jgi:gamma-glutamyltranspeptidase/glutathione hydrolase